jgi:hypothetical protein
MRRWWHAVLLCSAGLASSAAAQTPPTLTAAIQQVARRRGEQHLPAFEHALIDLDGDGRLDAIVLLSGSMWCGSKGCQLLVLRGTSDGYVVVSAATVAREAIRVSSETCKGWKTLIVNSRGVGDVLMRFDGTRYPSDPALQPKATHDQLAAAKTIVFN